MSCGIPVLTSRLSAIPEVCADAAIYFNPHDPEDLKNKIFDLYYDNSKKNDLIKNGTISGKIGKTIFELMLDGDKDPQIIVEEKGLKQESDPKALEALIDKIINDNREKAIEYKNGKEKLFGFFVGQAMKVSGGKANPQLINEILKKKL